MADPKSGSIIFSKPDKPGVTVIIRSASLTTGIAIDIRISPGSSGNNSG